MEWNLDHSSRKSFTERMSDSVFLSIIASLSLHPSSPKIHDVVSEDLLDIFYEPVVRLDEKRLADRKEGPAAVGLSKIQIDGDAAGIARQNPLQILERPLLQPGRDQL